MITVHLVISLLLTAEPAAAGDTRAEAPKAKVIASFHDRQSTKLIIESREPLVAGSAVYVGPERTPAALGGLLSRSDPVYYYGAIIAGKKNIPSGAEVSLTAGRAGELPQNVLKQPGIMSFNLAGQHTFDQKRLGEVTAIQNGRAMIDRGTLHEVRERDLYRVYDSSGRYKGMLEIHGMGDLQSSGSLYNRIEDFGHRRRVNQTTPGDRVEFAGQRKLFGLGAVGAVRHGTGRVLNRQEETFGAGLLWNVTFRDGWGAEALFGVFSRSGSAELGRGTFPNHVIERNSVDVKFVLPVWFKKNFFYPSAVSPFMAAGFSFLRGSNSHQTLGSIASSEDKLKFTIVPMLGGGVEFFPGRFFRPRLEVRYFNGPRIQAGPSVVYTESVFYGAGFATTW